MPEFNEEEYLDVLQNIEAALVSIYQDNPDMTDYTAMAAVEKLARTYQFEAEGRLKSPPSMNGLTQAAYDQMQFMCEWRLGRVTMESQQGNPLAINDPVTIPEIVACLKRIRRSIELWNKEGGRRGYFEYVRQFLPG